jgi:hypothetical protein
MQENVYLTLTTSILGDGMASSLEEATQKQLLLFSRLFLFLFLFKRFFGLESEKFAEK